MTISKRYGRHTVTTGTPDPAKAAAIAQLKSRAIKGSATGVGIAAGAATAEVALAGAATAAEATVAVVETVALVPTILTVAAIGGAGWLAWKGYQYLSK